MAEYLTTTEELASVADSIRAKGSTSEPLVYPQGFVDAVKAIQTGGGVSAEIQQFIDGLITENWADYKSDTLIIGRANSVATSRFKSMKIKSVKGLNVTKVGFEGFLNCENLTEVNMPNLQEVGNAAFRDCRKLNHIDFPKLAITDSNSFRSLPLVEVNLPNLQIIGYDCFYLTPMVKFDGGKVTTIMTYAFEKVTTLEILILRGTTVADLKGTNALSTSGIGLGTGYVYVPKSLVEQYKAATNWVAFAAQIRAIEDYPEITGG